MLDEILEVDRIEIQVVIDNVTDSLSSAPKFVTNEWPNLFRAGLRRIDGACLCCANHGLALVVTAMCGDRRRTVLFDAGPSEAAFAENGKRLGIDFGSVEAIVLSHGHFDHAGGMPTAIEMIRTANSGRSVPIYLHPGMFAERAVTLPGGFRMPMKNIPTTEGFEGLGVEPVVTDRPQAILDGMFLVSGEIPRVTEYEEGLIGHMRRAADGGWEPDPWIMDERFLAVRIKDKGVFVFSACSHAGIINVMKHARTCFPGEPLFGLMGGFHLSGLNEKVIPQTVRDLAAFNLSVIAPGHCTGWRAVNALESAFGEPTVMPYAVGKAIDL